MSDTFLSWFYMKHSSEHCSWRCFILRCGRVDDHDPAMPVSDEVSWFTDAGKIGTVMTVTGRYDPDGQREV